MSTNQEQTAQEQTAYAAQADKLPTEEPKLLNPNWDSDSFFRQRKNHRTVLFYFSLTASALSLLFLCGVIITQIILRAKIAQGFEVISDQGLEIFAVAVFGQVFGVVYVIAKSVWSNDEFRLMNK